MITRNCVLCGSDRKVVKFEAKLPPDASEGSVIHSQYETPGSTEWWRYRIVTYEVCGHVYADPVFDPESVGDSYLEQEHDNQFGIDPSVLLRTNAGYAAVIEPFLRPSRGLLVDIGCDTGNFLRACMRFGFDRVVGVEPGVESAQAASRIEGVEIMQKLFDPGDFEPASIQLSSLIHVLDHLMEPVLFLEHLRERMSGGGLVFAIVHNIGSLLARVSGANWSPIGVIHFDYYGAESLPRLFKKAGYDVLALRRTTNFFPLYHLVRFAPGLPGVFRNRLFRMTSGPVLRKIVLGLKLGNIAIVAQNPDA